ncbi:hypothetical protein PsorP6_002312 [Peronosclerospora sorghi]|uniref:Uncharacterized protein n=1 Tax=Peronosclerospora sorghi TaxID=230839 RepID=A0ACC0WXW8_9STRA|nr:hypothetical protein PsorP6_002312 [Peronosclerospora sorghi]
MAKTRLGISGFFERSERNLLILRCTMQLVAKGFTECQALTLQMFAPVARMELLNDSDFVTIPIKTTDSVAEMG